LVFHSSTIAMMHGPINIRITGIIHIGLSVQPITLPSYHITSQRVTWTSITSVSAERGTAANET